jgi:hypothetical protein
MNTSGLRTRSDLLQLLSQTPRADGAEPNTSTSQRRRSGADGAAVHFRGAAKAELHGAPRKIKELAEQLTSEQVLSLV